MTARISEAQDRLELQCKSTGGREMPPSGTKPGDSDSDEVGGSPFYQTTAMRDGEQVCGRLELRQGIGKFLSKGAANPD